MLSMRQHILNIFRRFVLSAALKALPLRSQDIVEPDPVRSTRLPETDLWLFEADRSVASHMAGLTGEMSRLSGVLGRLHTVVSTVAAETPIHALSYNEHAVGQVIWSDDLLFDGEPLASAEDCNAGDDFSDLLFDERSIPGSVPSNTVELRAAL